MEGQQSYRDSLKFSFKLVPTDSQPTRQEGVTFIEQYVSEVLDFSSQYGSDNSISYTAYNITGKPSKFPDYGDFPQAFVMKTYGNWWKEAPSRIVDYMPQNNRTINSNDYIDIQFEQVVYPFRVSIYETYNPGSVVRIWALRNELFKVKWHMLWEGELVKVGHVPRMFSPIINIPNFKTNVLRIEFNHSMLEYYTGIDAVLLTGTEEPLNTTPDKHVVNLLNKANKENNVDIIDNSSHNNLILGKITHQVMQLNLHNIPNEQPDLQKVVEEYENNTQEEEEENGEHINNVFHLLPNETVLKILGYLDLRSLARCSQVNRHFNTLASDSFLYMNLSLRPYWNLLNSKSFTYLSFKCRHLQKLDLSWCGNYGTITYLDFNRFLINCKSNITHLRLNGCKFVDNCVIKNISDICKCLKELGLRNNGSVDELGFQHLTMLTQLEYLDLYRTAITTNALNSVLKTNPNLKHLNIGSCMQITHMDDIAETLANYNKNLVSLDLWKTYNLTQIGVRMLSQCSLLEEVDFGWCLGLGLTVPVDCISALAHGCPKLKKLFLGALRGFCDRDLEPFIKHCPDLEQIDLFGVRSISADMCMRMLMLLPKLKLLDLSFCDQIADRHVSSWKRLFPHVSIKRSFQNEVEPDFLYHHRLA